jgi:hypothetical protein
MVAPVEELLGDAKGLGHGVKAHAAVGVEQLGVGLDPHLSAVVSHVDGQVAIPLDSVGDLG